MKVTMSPYGPPGPRSFKNQVADNLGQWLANKAGRLLFKDLVAILGAPAVLDASSSADESVVRNAWSTVMHHYAGTASVCWMVETHLVAGLLKNDRWRDYLYSESKGHLLTSMLARYLHRIWEDNAVLLSESDVNMDVALRQELHAVLKQWVGVASCTYDASQRDLACALFGEAWCSLVLDTGASDVRLANLIETEQPTFLPGILAYANEQVPLHLPSLDC
jgi:hypothetical protein